MEKCSFTDQNRIVDSRSTPGQQECIILSEVTKEHPPTSARPIRKTIEYFEDLSTNQNTGMKRQIRGETESPAKYARTMGSNLKGLSKNYMRDYQQEAHTTSKGDGDIEYIHAQDRTDGFANDSGLSGSSLSPPKPDSKT